MSTAYPSTYSAPGFFAAMRQFLAAAASYLEARLSLLGIEVKESGLRVGIAVGMVIGALFVLLLAYLFFVFFAVLGVAAWIGGAHTIVWTTLGAAVLHLLVAAALVFLALKRFKEPFFPDSIDQLRKDQAWLKQTKSV